MKKTQWIELLQRIRKSWVSFIAIFVFVAFGVGLYTGLKWAEPSLYKAMESDYDTMKLRDFELVCSAGLTEAALGELSEIPEVSEIEGTYTAYQCFRHDGEMFQAKIGTVTKTIDLLLVKEGCLPKAENELAVDITWANAHQLAIGDTIVLEHDGDANAHLLKSFLDGKAPDPSFHNDDGMQYFQNDTFTVTAFVDSPATHSTIASKYEASPTNPSPVSAFFYVLPETFDCEAFTGFTGALIRSNSLRAMNTTDEEYKSEANSIYEKLLPKAELLGVEQSKRIHDATEKMKLSVVSSSPATVEPDGSVMLFTREQNGTITMIDTLGEILGKLCTNFGITFIIIGLLICYSTLSRLVYHESILTGTKKALGLFDGEITRSFLLYAGIVSFLGVVAGALLSIFVVQPVILLVLGRDFYFSSFHATFVWQEIAVIFLLETVAMLFAAYLASYKTLRRSPLSLLAGNEPPTGNALLFEKTKLYNRLPLLFKAIVKNFFTDRRRVIGTLIGIIGCTSLVVSSITFELSATESMDKQFSELQHFDTIVYFEPENNEAISEISKLLSAKCDRFVKAGVYRGTVVTSQGKNMTADLYVDDEAFGGTMEFYKTDGTPISLENGALLSCAFAKQNTIKSGDTLIYRDASQKESELWVSEVFEYYIHAPRIVMTSDAYEAAFGKQLAENAFLVEKGNVSIRTLEDSLSKINGYIYTRDYYADKTSDQAIIINLISAVMYLDLALSVVIALFVILEILMMFVTEKKREIITLIINGYTIRYTRKYITLDTIFLTVIGLFGGVVAGILLGAWDVKNMESDSCYFIHGVNPIACIIGAIYTAVLVIVMTLIALKRINHFRLTDINEV